MVLYCLLDEINGPTASLENARDFLFQKNLLKSSMSCSGCNAAISLVPCSFVPPEVSGRIGLTVLPLAKRKLVRGPVGHMQTGSQTSKVGQTQTGSGFLDTALLGTYFEYPYFVSW